MTPAFRMACALIAVIENLDSFDEDSIRIFDNIGILQRNMGTEYRESYKEVFKTVQNYSIKDLKHKENIKKHIQKIIDTI